MFFLTTNIFKNASCELDSEIVAGFLLSEYDVDADIIIKLIK